MFLYALNSNLANKFATISVTTTPQNFTDYLNLPNGFNQNNCVVISMSMYVAGLRYGYGIAGLINERLFVEFSGAKFRVFSSDTSVRGVSVTFMRTDI